MRAKLRFVLAAVAAVFALALPANAATVSPPASGVVTGSNSTYYVCQQGGGPPCSYYDVFTGVHVVGQVKVNGKRTAVDGTIKLMVFRTTIAPYCEKGPCIDRPVLDQPFTMAGTPWAADCVSGGGERGSDSVRFANCTTRTASHAPFVLQFEYADASSLFVTLPLVAVLEPV
jgi:hypothetical protein